MSTDHRLKLTQIKRFDQLIAYLRDEMGWPIARDSFDDVDDLFYEFSAEELGIDPKTSAKILEIKRLRPLSPKQPWGIFFVKFEPKKLPVIALRRILGQVALKRRSSANSPDRTAWSADDLLFISNYGDGDARQISFAHFSKSESSLDLPTLRVLGWNNLDTGLHLDAVAKELTENLTWPEEGGDLNQWRKSWSDVFKLGHNEVINTAKDLSTRLAELASSIRDRIKVALSIENDSGPLTILMNAFKSSLVNDLDNDSFSDMYAQTIAYGLLSARITDPSKKTVDDFTSHMRTSPFLRELMQTFLNIGGRKGKAGGPGIDFDELGVGDVIQLLDNVNIEAVLRDFGDKNRQEDPVMHFFEGFLQAYDKQIRKDRGVFYTPQPVVSYIVRSVHELLQTEFGLVDGLADITTWGEILQKHSDLKLPMLTDEPGEKRTISPDEPFVQILDPATGTATFLIEVIEIIYSTLTSKWKRERLSDAKQVVAWNEYVPKHLLPRLHAFELMMAPYAIAHMKVGLKLAETGYLFASDERARIYLTNALEPYQKQLNLPKLNALAHEASAVNNIKRSKRFTVVIGNPPYSGVSSNMSEGAQHLIDPYKFVDGVALNEKKLWLQDDYVKFFRKAQLDIENSKFGILGFISNHGYLDNPTFRGMRQNLIGTFNSIKILDLHGNANKSEKTPEGFEDKNVFDIRQGVSIFISAKIFHSIDSNNINFAELWGSRESKYHQLSIGDKLKWNKLSLTSPFYFFVTRNEIGRIEYENGISVIDIFPKYVSAPVTARDHFVIAFTKKEILERIEKFRSSTMSDNEIREFYFEGRTRSSKYLSGDSRGWKIPEARKACKEDKDWQNRIIKCAYRAFDERYVYWAEWMVDWSRPELTKEVVGIENICFITRRQMLPGNISYFLVSSTIPIDGILRSDNKGGETIFPLFIHEKNSLFNNDINQTSNISSKFIESIKKITGLKWINKSFGDLNSNFGARDILGYVYAVVFSNEYRTRFEDQIRVDFPRVPLPSNQKTFTALAKLGEKMVHTHLMNSNNQVEEFIPEFIGKSYMVEAVSWATDTVWIDRDMTSGFKGVSLNTWELVFGAHQVSQKWLKDRRGQILTREDIENYIKVVVALTKTITLMTEIDESIETNGGWSSSFLNKN